MIPYFFQKLLKKQHKMKKAITPKIGKKAESLNLLIKNGFNVPDAFFIPVNYYDLFVSNNSEFLHLLKGVEIPHEIVQKLKINSNLITLVKNFISSFPKGNSFAVRSSGIFEDLEGASFAGLYSSYLNQKNVDDVLQSIKHCWLSVYNKKVTSYCEQNNIPLDELKMGVIVQQMVNVDISGVAFSVNPLNPPLNFG